MKKSKYDLVLYSREVFSVKKWSPRERGRRGIESFVSCMLWNSAVFVDYEVEAFILSSTEFLT